MLKLSHLDCLSPSWIYSTVFDGNCLCTVISVGHERCIKSTQFRLISIRHVDLAAGIGITILVPYL